MTCTHQLWGAADGLRCLRTDDHDTGHTYAASEAPDRHDLTEGGADQ